METVTAIFTILVAGLRGVRIVLWVLGIRVIGPTKVGVVEKLWSVRGLLRRCGLVSVDEKVGLLPEVLSGGVYFFYFPWQYRVHKLPTVDAGRRSRIGAREGLRRRLGRMLQWALPRAVRGEAPSRARGLAGYLQTLTAKMRRETAPRTEAQP